MIEKTLKHYTEAIKNQFSLLFVISMVVTTIKYKITYQNMKNFGLSNTNEKNILYIRYKIDTGNKYSKSFCNFNGRIMFLAHFQYVIARKINLLKKKQNLKCC